MNDAGCPVSFWTFAGPVLIGSMASLGTSYLARHLASKNHPETADTIGRVTGLATFWLAGGLSFVVLNKRPKRITP